MQRFADLRGALVFVTPATLIKLSILAALLVYIIHISLGGASSGFGIYADPLGSALFLRTL